MMEFYWLEHAPAIDFLDRLIELELIDRSNPHPCKCGRRTVYGNNKNRVCTLCYEEQTRGNFWTRHKKCPDCDATITREATRCRSCASFHGKKKAA